MTFQQATQFLYSLSNLPRKEYMKDSTDCSEYLPRVQFFLDILGNPEKQIPHYIHITGTSGKGSTTAMIHNILHAAGKNVGSTSSPHLRDITDRWKVGGKNMSKQQFVDIIEQLKPALDEYMQTSPYDSLSYFDVTTAMAFLFFAQQQVEYTVIEVGCGGTFDSTNVMPHKDIAVITNIGLDHTELLGNTKQEIANKKAGIITGECSVFTAEKSRLCLQEIQKQADRHNAPVSTVRKPTDVNTTTQGITFSYNNESYALPVFGEHQAQNAAIAIDVATQLGISTRAIKKGLRTISLPMRMEVVQTNPNIIIDGAHNEDKIASSVKTLLTMPKHKHARIHLLVGFSENKDVRKTMKSLAKLSPASISCTRTISNHFRKVASPAVLCDMGRKLLPKAKVYMSLDPAQALDWSRQQLGKHDILLVTGSIFVASDIAAIVDKY